MSVRFFMMARDVPDRCAHRVCDDPSYMMTDSDGVFVDVSYLYEDGLKQRYPALYPAFFEGKRCRQVTYRLNVALRNARHRELRGYSYLTQNDRLRRLDGMLSGLSKVLQVCLDHPDWKLVVES